MISLFVSIVLISFILIRNSDVKTTYFRNFQLKQIELRFTQENQQNLLLLFTSKPSRSKLTLRLRFFFLWNPVAHFLEKNRCFLIKINLFQVKVRL